MTLPTRIIIENAEIRFETISTVEDLWHDVQHFTAQARAENVAGRTVHENRYLRAATFALFAYLEGVVNQWWVGILSKRTDVGDFLARLDKKCGEGKASKGLAKIVDPLRRYLSMRGLVESHLNGIARFVRFVCLEKKCELLSTEFACSPLNGNVWDTQDDCRNALMHPKPGEDMPARPGEHESFCDALNLARVEGTRTEVERWLTCVSAATGLQPHPDTRLIGNQRSLPYVKRLLGRFGLSSEAAEEWSGAE